jgi:hypothetical protein
MEIKQLFKNYNEGGNNYILKADSQNKWCGFNKNIIYIKSIIQTLILFYGGPNLK